MELALSISPVIVFLLFLFDSFKLVIYKFLIVAVLWGR